MKNFAQLIPALFVGLFGFAAQAQNLKIYTTRNEAAMKPLLDLFSKENPGVTFTWVKGRNWDVVAELEKQGAAGDGDIYLTKDLVYLNEAAEKGLLLKFDTTEARKNIPEFMIDKGNQWVGLALRARTFVYNPELLDPSELSTYADLADSKWAARMCLRTSLSSYSVAYTSSLIHHLGRQGALDVLKGWVDNTAIEPTIGDELLLESIDAGICEVGVINTHYMATQLTKNPALKAKVAFANQGTTGTHMNGSGVAILKASKHPALVKKFIDFLTRTDVQTQFATQQNEYPGNPKAAIPAPLKAFGTFQQDQTSWTDLGAYLKESRQLFIEAEYN